MNFLDYIKGQRKGKGAHRIEKESMKDPFLSEAIEGFDSIDDDHIRRIGEIQSRLKTKSKATKKRHPLWQIAAASVIIVIAAGGYFIIGSHKSNLHAQEANSSSIIDIYVPERFYAENITVIAQTNTTLAKSYKPSIHKFKVGEENTDISITDEEREILSGDVIAQQNTPIEVYIPEELYERGKDRIIPLAKDGKPQPIIGFEKYNAYLKAALRRPTDDACKDRKGKVAVEFSVDENGQPYEFDVKYSLCGTSDNEAIRLIQSGPLWTLGSERVMVKVQF